LKKFCNLYKKGFNSFGKYKFIFWFEQISPERAPE